jgi:hypothetical protein
MQAVALIDTSMWIACCVSWKKRLLKRFPGFGQGIRK